jgi:hypothetical protein
MNRYGFLRAIGLGLRGYTDERVRLDVHEADPFHPMMPVAAHAALWKRQQMTPFQL